MNKALSAEQLKASSAFFSLSELHLLSGTDRDELDKIVYRNHLGGKVIVYTWKAMLVNRYMSFAPAV